MMLSKQKGMSYTSVVRQSALRWLGLGFDVQLWQHVDCMLISTKNNVHQLWRRLHNGAVHIFTWITSIREKTFTMDEGMAYCGYKFCVQSPSKHRPNAS